MIEKIIGGHRQLDAGGYVVAEGSLMLGGCESAAGAAGATRRGLTIWESIIVADIVALECVDYMRDNYCC